MKKFDGEKVKQVKFGDLGWLSRFFTDNGIGYTKSSDTTCYDDHSFQKILVDSETKVWIKK